MMIQIEGLKNYAQASLLSYISPSLTHREGENTNCFKDGKEYKRPVVVHSSLERRRILSREVINKIIRSSSSNEPTFPPYIDKQFSKLQTEKEGVQFYQPVIKQTLKKLQESIKERQVQYRTPDIKQPAKYFYTEYVMRKHKNKNLQKGDSPTIRPIKEKSLLYKSKNIYSPANSKHQNQENKKSMRQKQLFVLGGSLQNRPINNLNIEIRDKINKKRISKEQKIRSLPHLKKVSKEQIIKNNDKLNIDCKPWQIHKLQHLQSYGNFANL